MINIDKKYLSTNFEKEICFMSKVLLTRYSVGDILASSKDNARIEFQKRIALGIIKEVSYEHPDGSWCNYGLLPQGFRPIKMKHECEEFTFYFAINSSYSDEFSANDIPWGMDANLPEGSLKWDVTEKRWVLYSNQK